MEKLIIQEVADTSWKLQRVAVYESGLQAKGRWELKERFHSEDLTEAERHIIVEAEVQRTYSKEFTNLSLQQDKAQKHLEKKIAQFEKIRNERELLDLSDRKVAMEASSATPMITVLAIPTSGPFFQLTIWHTGWSSSGLSERGMWWSLTAPGGI